MEDWIATLPGPYRYAPPVVVAALLWWFRASLRKRHVVLLVALTALGLIGLGVFGVLGLARNGPPRWLVMGGLHASAVLVAGCGPMVLLAFALLQFGHSKVQPPLRGRSEMPDPAPLPLPAARAAPAAPGPDFADTLPQPAQTAIMSSQVAARAPSPAEQIAARLHRRARTGQLCAGAFLAVVLPALGAAILFALQRGISSGVMQELSVRSATGAARGRTLTLAQDTSVFVQQSLLLLAVAGLCLWGGWKAALQVVRLWRQPHQARP